MKKLIKENLPILITMLLWGSLFPIIKVGFKVFEIEGVADILFFAGCRFAIGGGAILIFCLIRNREVFRNVKKYLPLILLGGAFAVILHYAFTYIGLTMIDSSKTAILKKTGVIFYVLFSGLFSKTDRLTVRKLIGVLMGLAGIILLNIGSLGFTLSVGTVLTIGASFCTIFSNMIGKKVVQTIDPVVQTGISQFFGGVVLLIAGLSAGGGMRVEFRASELIFVYICAASVVSYCIWFGVIKNRQLSKMFIYQFSEAIFAAIFGAILLSEKIFDLKFIAAFILIFVGITIANSSGEKEVKGKEWKLSLVESEEK